MSVATNDAASLAAIDDDTRLVELLRAGDEQTFVELIGQYHAVMLRLANVYVRDPAVAQDVVQDTWLGVVRGLDLFAARSRLKTWIFQILVNTARTRAVREKRTIPMSALGDPVAADSFESAVEPERFMPVDALQRPGHWASLPHAWGASPEERLLLGEARSLIHAAIDSLPPSQREVVTLRDSEGWTTEEACNILQITETYQRVLLHRGRSRVRRALEQYLTGT